MQSVVRSSLVGLLALASLTACGDKVTPVTITTSPPPSVVHSVTVTPNTVPNLAIGSSITLTASVDADAGVTVRTVTWASSDATVASVDGTGKVTGVKAGTVTISAAATADPAVKGAALVTVGGSAVPVVTISSINQTNAAGQSVPATLSNVQGQIDVILNVDANGQALKTISSTVKCGNDSVTQTQTISSNVASLDASEAAAPVTMSFNTAAFTLNAAGLATVALHNGSCTVTATATTTGNQSASNTTQFTLNNTDVVVVKTAFAGGASANDLNGLPWKSGNATVSASPVLYSGRTPATVSITLPGAANIGTQTVPAVLTGATTATWTTATSGGGTPRIGQQTLIGGYDSNGFPTGIHPTVLVIDSNGIDLSLAQANPATESDFRIDNQSPSTPQILNIPTPVSSTNATGMNGWIGSAYVFTGDVGRYISAGDWGVGNGSGKGPAVPLGTTINGQVTGCSTALVGGLCTGTVLPNSKDGRLPDAGVSTSSGLVTGAATFTYFAAPVVNYTNLGSAGAPGSATGASCVTTGLTAITTGGDLAATLVNSAYKVRVFETDKLGNVRCTDIGGAVAVSATAPAIQAVTFGVDKTAPSAAFADPPVGTSALDKAIVNAASAPPVGAFQLVIADTGSGFTATPALTFMTRLFPGLTAGQGCVIGTLNGSNVCANTISTASLVQINGSVTATTVNGCNVALLSNGSCPVGQTNVGSAVTPAAGSEGYYTLTTTVRDQAQNSAATLTRQSLVDITPPQMGGISTPATIIGGAAASFSTSATDNLDLVSSSYTLAYNTNIANPPAGSLALQFRTDGPSLGTAFDNVLTTTSSFSVTVAQFLRNVQVTDGTDTPVAFSNPGNLPTSMAARVADAAGNNSTDQTAAIGSANVPQTNPAAVSFQALVGFNKWLVANAATPLCNATTTACANPPGNPTSTTLRATAVGTLSTFQLPFTQVQFYYFDNAPGGTNQWKLIGSSVASSVTDDGVAATRTFTWTISFDPPAAFGTGGAAVPILAVGMNVSGDALASRANSNITVTP